MTGYSSIKIIFIDQDPKGIKRLEPYMSTLVIMVVPRNYIKRALSLEMPGYSRGIYFLVDDSHTDIYVGQTVQGLERLQNHDKKKDFWTTAIMFLNVSKLFTLDMISGMERYAIEKTREESSYNVLNVQNPKYNSGRNELEAIKSTYEDIKFVMAYLGYDLVKINDGSLAGKGNANNTTKGATAANKTVNQTSNNSGIVYYDLSTPVKPGTKPAAVKIEDKVTMVKSWKDILVTMLTHIGEDKLREFAKDEEGKKHPLVSEDKSKLRSAYEAFPGLWAETNMDSQSIINLCRRLEDYANLSGSQYGMNEAAK